MRRRREASTPRRLVACAKNSILNYVESQAARDPLAGLRIVAQVEEQREAAQLRRQVAALSATLAAAEVKLRHARMAAPVLFAHPHAAFYHARDDDDAAADEDYFCFLGMTHGDGRKGIGSSHEDAGLERAIVLQKEACYVFRHLCGEGAFGNYLDPRAWCAAVGHFDWRTEFVRDGGAPRPADREFVVHPSRVAGFKALTRAQWGRLRQDSEGARRLRRVTGHPSDDESSESDASA